MCECIYIYIYIIYICISKYNKDINAKEKSLQEKMLNATTVEQAQNLEKYQIMNTRSSLL